MQLERVNDDKSCVSFATTCLKWKLTEAVLKSLPWYSTIVALTEVGLKSQMVSTGAMPGWRLKIKKMPTSLFYRLSSYQTFPDSQFCTHWVSWDAIGNQVGSTTSIPSNALTHCMAAQLRKVDSKRCKELGRQTGRWSSLIEQTPKPKLVPGKRLGTKKLPNRW